MARHNSMLAFLLFTLHCFSSCANAKHFPPSHSNHSQSHLAPHSHANHSHPFPHYNSHANHTTHALSRSNSHSNSHSNHSHSPHAALSHSNSNHSHAKAPSSRHPHHVAYSKRVTEPPFIDGKGQWQLLLDNTEVVAMHMALTHHNTVIIFDQTEAGPSGHQLRRRYNGTRCTQMRKDVEDSSCYAHSVEYDIANNKLRPLTLLTDTWCSSGSFLSNGTLLQTGGHAKGAQRVRYFSPCGVNEHERTCDWRQSKQTLTNDRWFSSSLRLPEDDWVIVVGGRKVFTYEFIPKQYSNYEGSFDFPFLRNTFQEGEGGNNMYPFLHICPNGRLFIFSNRDSILFNYRANVVVKYFPRIPGEGSRNFPSSGSSVLLPLDYSNNFERAEVMVCGGASNGAYIAARAGKYLKALSSCGRMMITGNKHKWNMEFMPGPRLLSDMIILPTGDVLLINGAKNGAAGWNNARNASLEPYLYHPKKALSRRFTILKATRIPRMYHSSAVLLPDGRVLVAGSNPHDRYMFEKVAYPTELSLQAFVPPYLVRQHRNSRPSNVTVHYNHYEPSGVRHAGEFTVKYWLGTNSTRSVEFTAYAPPYTSHSVSMNQRLLKLRCKTSERDKDGWVKAVLEAPPTPAVAPAGYYMLTVVNKGIPSVSQWVKILNTARN